MAHRESSLWWLRFAAQQIGNFTRGFDFSDVACEYIIYLVDSTFRFLFLWVLAFVVRLRGSWYKIAFVKAYEVHTTECCVCPIPYITINRSY
jgi:hypothetical protein